LELFSLVTDFLSHPVGVTLRFDENRKLFGGTYQISFSDDQNKADVKGDYEAMKIWLSQRYGSPVEDTQESFADALENNGTVGAYWENHQIKINLYITHKTLPGQNYSFSNCEIEVKEYDTSFLIAGFSPGTTLKEVLSQPDILPWGNRDSAQLRLFIPDETVFGLRSNATYLFGPRDGGKLYTFYYKSESFDDINAAADLYASVLNSMKTEYGEPSFESAPVDSAEFLQNIHTEIPVMAIWDKDISKNDNLQISLELDFSAVRKDLPQEAVLRISFGTKESAALQGV